MDGTRIYGVGRRIAAKSTNVSETLITPTNKHNSRKRKSKDLREESSGNAVIRR